MNLTPSATQAIQRYVASVSRYLGSMPADERRAILGDLKAHVLDALKARGAGEPVDVDAVTAVLAEMDPPESYAKVEPTMPAHQGAGLQEVTGPAAASPRALIIGGAVILAMVIVAAAFAWWQFYGGSVKTAMGTVVRQRTPEQLIESDFAARDKWDTEALVLVVRPENREPLQVPLKAMEEAEGLKAAFLDLADAMEKAYGKPQEELRKRADAITAPMNRAKDGMRSQIAGVYANGRVDWTKMKLEVHGDKGRVQMPGPPSGMTDVVKIGDKWYEDIGAPPEPMGSQIKGLADQYVQMIADVKDMAAKVRSGELTEAKLAERMTEFSNRARGVAASTPNESPDETGISNLGPPKKRPQTTPRPPAPEKPKVTDLASALEALKSDDVFRQGDAVTWIDKAKITEPADHEAICAVATQQLEHPNPFHKGDFTRLMCEHCGEKQLPQLIKLAGSTDGGEYQSALVALFRIAPDEGRKVVRERATEVFVRMFVMGLFKKEPEKYAGQAALLLSAPNPDLQRDMVRLLTDIGGEESMQPLRDYKEKLGDSREEAGRVRDADHALQTIRQRIIDHGKAMPPEPVTDVEKLGRPKSVDSALAALRSKDYQDQKNAVEWLEASKLDKDEDVQKVVAATGALCREQGPFKAQLAAVFIRYAGEKSVDDLAAVAGDKDKSIYVPAWRKLFKLSSKKAHNVVLARAEDTFFRMDLFKELRTDPGAYEGEAILCIDVPSKALRSDAVRALTDIGSSKSLTALQKLKAGLNAKTDGLLIHEIDRAVSAIQTRMKIKGK